MADPLTLSAGAIFSAIGTTFKLAEFCLALKEVSSDSRIFLTLIQRVRKDLDEALRERNEKSIVLQAMPGKKDWIDGAIMDVKRSLLEIGLMIENARVDGDKGKSVTLKHRFEWVLSNHQKFVTREMALSTCHASLLSAISAMHTLTSSPAMLSPALSQQSTSFMPVSPFASSTSLATLSPPPIYEPASTPDSAALQDPEMLKSPLRRRPKTIKATSTPALESRTEHYGYQPGLRHQYSNSSIQDSLFNIEPSYDPETRSLSYATSPQIPNFDFPNMNPNYPSGNTLDSSHSHSRSHSNSVPNITYHHHDSVSSISSDGAKSSFPYFDPTIPSNVFELEQPYDRSNVSGMNSRRVSEASYSVIESANSVSSQRYPQSPSSYTPEPTSSWHPSHDTSTDILGNQSEGGLGMSGSVQSRKPSNAQDRQRRARARFEMG